MEASCIILYQWDGSHLKTVYSNEGHVIAKCVQDTDYQWAVAESWQAGQYIDDDTPGTGYLDPVGCGITRFLVQHGKKLVPFSPFGNRVLTNSITTIPNTHKFMVAGPDNLIRIYKFGSSKSIGKIKVKSSNSGQHSPPMIAQIQQSPDGHYLAVGYTNDLVQILNLKTHRWVYHGMSKQYSFGYQNYNPFSFSHNGKILITCDHYVSYPFQYQHAHPIPNLSPLSVVACSPASNEIAVIDNSYLTLYRTTNWKEI